MGQSKDALCPFCWKPLSEGCKCRKKHLTKASKAKVDIEDQPESQA